MSRICIIYTGGTIGMVDTGHGLSPQKNYLRKVLENNSDLYASGMPEWELLEFDDLYDSSNIAVPEWNHIAEVISDNYDKYDGFVVLHGTDTMAYTASALSFMLENLGKPVILTGSQIPIGAVRSDARENLITSMLIAADGKCPEVGLYFGGKLLRGNRSTKVSADEMNAFDSLNYPPLAGADITIHYNEKFIRKAEKGFRAFTLEENIPIAVLKIFPGIQFSFFESIMTEKLRGLVLEAFGVGNVPQYDDALLPLIRKAADNGTVIVVCTQCKKGTVQLGTYETSSALQDAGALSGQDMTVEAAVTKLAYLTSRGYTSDEIRRMMEEDLRGELTEK